MILLIRCNSCKRTIEENVQQGYSVGPILKRYGFLAAPGGHYCPDCINAIPATDFAYMNSFDNAGGKS